MAAKPQPGSAAGVAREYYRTHSHLLTANELVKVFVQDNPAFPPEKIGAVRLEFQRLISGRGTLDGTKAPSVGDVEVELEEERGAWRVEQGEYLWQTGNGHSFRLSVEAVDELFYAFSKHGLNLTQTQVINKYNLKTWQWNSLKARLGLTKLANVFSPHTEEITPKAELAAMMEAKMNARFENRGLIVEQSYSNSTNKQYQKVIANAEETAYLNQKVLAELADRFPQAKVRYMLKGPVAPSAPKVLAFTLADTHAGAKIKGMIRSFDYDREQMYHYADQLIEEVNAIGAEQVWMLGVGDYLETLTGLNHINSWKGADTFGADAIAAAYEFFVYFIDRIQNLTGILSVGGNHDRLTSNAKEDTAAGAAQAVFYFLKLNYGKLLDIEFHPALVTREIDGILYILKHGYTGDVSNEKKATDLIADFQTRGVFTLLVTADKHTRGVFLDGNRKRWVRSPAFFTGNSYSEDLGFTGLAGSLLIKAVKGFPYITDVPLVPLDKNNTFNVAA